MRVEGPTASAVGHPAVAERTNPRYTHAWLYEDAMREQVGAYTLVGGCAGYEGRLPRESGSDVNGVRAVIREVLAMLDNDVVLAAHLPTDEALFLTSADILPGRPTPVLGTVVAQLDLGEARTFDHYVSTLTRSNRSGVRRDLRRAAANRLRTETHSLADVIGETAPLLGQVQGHHGDDPSPEAAAAYLRLCCHEDLADIATAFVTADASGRPVAFALGYPWYDTLFMRVAGIDYERAASSGAYFESYFYAPIRYALSIGLTTVDFGGESLEGKLRRGSRLHPRWSLSVGADIDPADARNVTRARLASLTAPAGQHWAGSDAESWLHVHDALATPTGGSSSDARASG
ncbi:MAG: GNAT family N-acetyltransferase [Dermatophilaceae bacterium]